MLTRPVKTVEALIELADNLAPAAKARAAAGLLNVAEVDDDTFEAFWRTLDESQKRELADRVVEAQESAGEFDPDDDDDDSDEYYE